MKSVTATAVVAVMAVLAVVVAMAAATTATVAVGGGATLPVGRVARAMPVAMPPAMPRGAVQLLFMEAR